MLSSVDDSKLCSDVANELFIRIMNLKNPNTLNTTISAVFIHFYITLFFPNPSTPNLLLRFSLNLLYFNGFKCC